jgi:hypothetical protein
VFGVEERNTRKTDSEKTSWSHKHTAHTHVVKSDERACLSRVVVWLWERKKERVFEFVCLFVVDHNINTHT